MTEYARITRPERAVLELLVQGLTNSEIAGRLSLSPWTIKRHVSRLLERTGQRRRVDLAVWYSEQARQAAPNERAAD